MKPEHPITPPDELVQHWWDGTHGAFYEFEAVATQAARWGADQELEACCGWLSTATYGDTLGAYSTKDVAVDLRAARRPKPPSLKEQAKFAAAVLRSPDETCSIAQLQQHWHTICNALEQLND